MNELIYFGVAIIGFGGGFACGYLHREAQYWAEQSAYWKKEGERLRANR